MHLCLIIRLSSVSYHLNFEKNNKIILPTWEAPHASTLGIDLRRKKIHQNYTKNVFKILPMKIGLAYILLQVH
jgi:hypothetical protein